MHAQADNTFPCQDCGTTLFVVHPSMARTVVCGACGAHHDLYARGLPVIDHIPMSHHRPEGLLEVGRSGRMGQRVVQVIGRMRLADFEGSQVRTWDEWVLITAEGRYLRIREEQGNYAILVPFQPEAEPPAAVVDRAPLGTEFLLDGRPVTLTRRSQAKVLFVEGEHTSRVCVGDRLRLIEVDTPDGPLVSLSSMDGTVHHSLDPVEDRAMWAIFGYTAMLRAHDALYLGEQRALEVARGFSQASTALFAASLLGGLLMLGVVTSGTDIAEGWARFDGAQRDQVAETVMGTATLAPGWGFYTLDAECGLDAVSEGIEILAESPTGQRLSVARCLQDSEVAQVGRVTRDFRVKTPGTWRLLAVHRAMPEEPVHAHVSFGLTWTLGSAWWPLYGLLVLMVLGLLTLVAWPIARRAGLPALEEAFEMRRAELALALRRRRSRGEDDDDPESA